MELTLIEFNYLGRCLEGFFFGMISVNSQAQFAKAVQHCAIPGLYSGIFAMYLQRRGSQQGTDMAKNILFYALWMLYALTMATSIIDVLEIFWIDGVSMDDHRCLTFFSISFTEHRDTKPPSNYRSHSICLLRRHDPDYPSTYSWQWLSLFI